MAATDPTTLVSQASCFFSCIPPGMEPAVQTYLLALLAGADTSNPQALASAASCFQSCIPVGEQMAVQNYLLSLLLS